MKLIRFEDILKLNIPSSQFYDWAGNMLLHKKDAILPPKISMQPSLYKFCNVMPCILPNKNIMGMKVVTRYPKRAPSLSSQIMIYTHDTGELLAIMDGTFITAMRTGAVAAHSINTFAKSNFSSVGIIGLGNTARATMEIFASVSTDKKYHIGLLNYKNHAEIFEKRFRGYDNLIFSSYDSASELIANHDVIISCVTYADKIFADDCCYKPGCTVIPVHSRGFQNCDLFFDKVFADDTDHVRGFENFEKFKSFAETYDVIAGKSSGRTSDFERILIYNIGISIHDIYFAGEIYARLGHLPDIDNLTNCDMQFWV